VVWINRPDTEARADIEAAVFAGVGAINLTKAKNADHIKQISVANAQREIAEGIQPGRCAWCR